MAIVPKPRQRVEYKRPSRVNVVSVSLALFLAGLVYVAFSLWPVFQLRANAKSEMFDTLPHLWRYNRRPDSIARPEILRLKSQLTERLIKVVGIKDPKLQVNLIRGPKVVAIEVTFKATATFPYLDKKIVLPCSPRVETDSAHIEW